MVPRTAKSPLFQLTGHDGFSKTSKNLAYNHNKRLKSDIASFQATTADTLTADSTADKIRRTLPENYL